LRKGHSGDRGLEKGAIMAHITPTRILILLSLLFAMLVSACTTAPQKRSNLKRLYDKSAQYHQPDRNPVIVIPGILGSRLVDNKTGMTVWGAFRRDFANPKSDDGARLIALPLSADLAHDDNHHIKTSVRPDGVLESLQVDLAGIPISIQAYAGILTTLGAGGYRDESLGLNSIDYGTDHYTCFQFDYDWRQDIPSNAARLKTFIDEKRKDIQQKYKEDFGIENAEIKFDIVGHSMGAILSRYFARYGAADLDAILAGEVPWSGAKDVERLILVAPPNAGSLEAMDQLLNGFNTGRPVLPYYHQALIGSFPSVYQLLPRTRHKPLVWDGDINQPVKDMLDPNLWQRMKWGLSGEDEETDTVLISLMPDVKSMAERRKIARAYQKAALQRASLFHMAMDATAQVPADFEMFLVAGDNRKTPAVASIDKASGAFSILRYELGDETVTRGSALLDERVGQKWEPRVVSSLNWSSTLFIPGKHRTITSGPIFEDNVLFWLLEDPRN
jgi:pimeloyl-ACP methyl ester carboxylesterase